MIAYKECQNPRLKIQILTLITDSYSKESIMQFFEISKRQLDKAFSQIKLIGIGKLEDKEKYCRNKITKASIDIFLNFITSDDYMQDVAYGDKIMKLENGDQYIIPHTARLACNTKIIKDYHSICDKENIKPFESTCYKILKNCPASFRKSMAGLDNVICDGLNAFDGLEKIIHNLKSIGLKEEDFKLFNNVLNFLEKEE